MHQAVDGRGCGHGVFKDGLPFGERQITGNYDAAPLIAFRQQGKQHLHLLPGLLHIPDVVQDHRRTFAQLFQPAAQLQLLFGPQEFLDEKIAVARINPMPITDQFLSQSAGQVGFTAAGVPEDPGHSLPASGTSRCAGFGPD